ncbi:MAG: hypothetical protein EOO43_04395 [Flavobacterium sp.]|nr:MAG: hypothetical protein EOO43_04395 [Flavobacterium sp.]
MGKTKIIGIISLISLIMNGILGYFFLFLFHFNISPLALILYASIIAELIGIFMMFYTIRNLNVKIEQNIPIKKIIITTITKSSYYPALSNLSFHIGSFLLFLFCSTYFSLNETAILTLMLSYWGLLLVPAEAFSETSLNLFSLLISRKQNCFFLQLRSNIILTSLYVSVILFTAILFMDIIIYDTTLYKITLIFNIILLVIVGTFNEIFSISLIVKFKNRLFALSKIIYGSIAIIFTVVLTLILENRAIAILLSLLIAQLCTFFFLRRKSTQLWTK